MRKFATLTRVIRHEEREFDAENIYEAIVYAERLAWETRPDAVKVVSITELPNGKEPGSDSSVEERDPEVVSPAPVGTPALASSEED